MGDDIALEIVDEIKHRNASNHFDDKVLNSLMNRSKILMKFLLLGPKNFPEANHFQMGHRF